MYVLAANTTSIDVLSLNAPGQAQNIQKLSIAGPAEAAGLTVSKYHGIVTSNISAYQFV